MMTQLLWTRHSDFPDAKGPVRAHETDAGFDLFTAETCSLEPGSVVKIRTGICVHAEPFQEEGKPVITPGGYNQAGGWTYACLVWDKSGLAGKGFTILGGVIDDPYTGEIMIIGAYLNLRSVLEKLLSGPVVGKDKFLSNCALRFEKHQKICNLLVQRVELPRLCFRDQLVSTERGDNGFGSTGL